MLPAIASPRERRKPAWPKTARMALGNATLDSLAVRFFRRSEPIRQTLSALMRGHAAPRAS